MKLLFYGVAVIAICLLIACGRSSGNKANSQDMDLAPVTSAKQEEQKPASDKTETADTATVSRSSPEDIALQSGSPALTDWDKKIVKTATLSLEVKDFTAFNADIHNSIKKWGAYTAGEQQNEADSRIENNLTIKVPVDQFDALINSISGEGITVLSKEVSTDDVSSEVIDTKARIEAKKQVRDKYEELLKQAKTMKDILQVQSEINNIQEELEAAAGRVNYLTHSAAYSTVTIKYFQYLNGISADDIKPSFLTNVKEAFTAGGSVFINIFLFLVSVWPLLLAGGLLYVYFKRRKFKKVSV